MQFKSYQVYFVFAITLSLITGGASAHASTNTAAQIIAQKQTSLMESLCASGGSTLFSCNNLNIQNQNNKGNNVASQENNNDNNGKKGNDNGKGKSNNNGGNSATQIISQSQSSNQKSNCVSGGSTSNSCNNFNSQSQNNYGSNVLSQR